MQTQPSAESIPPGAPHNTTPTKTQGPAPIMAHTSLLSTEVCISFAEKGHQILSMLQITFLYNNNQVIPYLQHIVTCLSKLVTSDDYSRTLFRLIFKIHFKCSANIKLFLFWFITFSSNWINFIFQKISFYLRREKQVFILNYNEITFSHKIYSDGAFSPQKW